MRRFRAFALTDLALQAQLLAPAIRPERFATRSPATDLRQHLIERVG